MNKDYNFTFVVSPNVGYLELLLPIIDRLLRKDIKIAIVFPEEVMNRKIDFSTIIFNLLKKYDLTYFIILNDFKSDIIKLPGNQLEKVNKYLNLFRRIVKYIPIAKSIIKIFFKMSFGLYKLDEKIRVDYMFFDSYVLHKKHMKNVYTHFQVSKNWISIHHAIGLISFEDYRTNDYFPEFFKSELDKLFALTSSKAESFFWEHNLNVKKSHIMTCGIIRHDKRWIEKITSNKISSRKKFILLISRPEREGYLNHNSKSTILKELITVIDNQNLGKLLVKLHPKDTSKKIYFENLGRENYGTLWEFTNSGPFELKNSLRFCVTLWKSNVILDLMFLGIPVIQRSNIENVKSVNNSNVHIKKNLVLFASNYKEFIEQINNVIINRKNVVDHQLEAYHQYFADPSNIVNNIMDFIGLENKKSKASQ